MYFFILGNVYGFNNSAANNALLQELSCKISQLKGKFPSAFLITIGSLFTWFKADMSKKFRIDLWLISDCLSPYIYSCEISPAPLTDHAGISLILSKARKTNNINSGYWKLNCSFLDQNSYIVAIQDFIKKYKDMTDIYILKMGTIKK